MKKLVIESQTCSGDWDEYAYPKYDFDEAKNLLKELCEEESTKKYRKPLRLVHITRETIKLDINELHETGTITQEQWDGLSKIVKGNP